MDALEGRLNPVAGKLDGFLGKAASANAFMYAMDGASPAQRQKIVDNMLNSWRTGVEQKKITPGFMDRTKGRFLRWMPSLLTPARVTAATQPAA
jgi:hypothetical protein